MSLTYREDLDMLNYPFYAVSDLAGGSLFIVELLQETPE
jgi:hypothetical protein